MSSVITSVYVSLPRQMHTLAIGMGTGSPDSIIRWVWQANPQHPVHEEASPSFGPEGNLVLSQPDGRVIW